MDADAQVLIAEDDETEAAMYDYALRRAGILNYLIVPHGGEVIRYLRGEGQYADRTEYPFPRWLILDLNMPRVSGFEVLEWLARHNKCKVVPTIVFSNSRQHEDIKKAYELGANAFFNKPNDLNTMIDVLALVRNFWTVAEVAPLTPGS
jgi:CheY-like chemotaxis protein